MNRVAIDASTLAEWIERAPPLVILDARARLNDADAGHALWQQQHVPGAHHADMDRDLSAPPTPRGGRHPLPDTATFAARLREWGITPEHSVVVYDDTGGQMAAARAWWLLTWAGHPSVHVLDGGWQAWQTAGYATERGVQSNPPSDWQPHFDNTMIASADDVAQGDAVLLDARPEARFRGESEPLDAAAGHIPGARNLPGATLLDAKRAFLPVEELGGLLPASDNVIAYCGSGISACQLILAHALAGRPLPRLYPGSWSAWSRNPNRPVATGAA